MKNNKPLKKRRIIGIFTIIAGIPGLWSPFLFFITPLSLKVIFLFLLGFVTRGLAGVVGGIGLWKGKKWGYQLACIMWGFLALSGIFNLCQVYFGGEEIQAMFILDEGLKAKTLAKSAGCIFWGFLINYTLIRDLRKLKKEISFTFSQQKDRVNEL